MLNNVAGANIPNYAQRVQDTAHMPAAVQNQIENLTESGVLRAQTQELGDCYTCSNRRYQDVSDDPGVSFQAPTRLTPGQAAIAVPNHEREHYMREESNAMREGREVLSNQIRIFHDTCPECGRTYVSGGETRTVTAYRQEEEDPHVAELIGGGLMNLQI